MTGENILQRRYNKTKCVRNVQYGITTVLRTDITEELT